MSSQQEKELISGLIRAQRPKIAIEVGVAWGGMSAKIVQAIEQNIIDSGEEAWYTGFDGWEVHGLQNQFDAFGTLEDVDKKLAWQSTHYALVKIDTQKNQSEFRSELTNRFTNGIDFAFIDGCHSYQGIANDFFNVWPHMNPHGIVAFHDTAVIDGCREFIADLRTHNNGSYDISDYPIGHPRAHGVTVITKPGYGDIKIDEICGSPSTPDQIYEKEQLNQNYPPLDQWWIDNLKERI